jgi:hypothetical protein
MLIDHSESDLSPGFYNDILSNTRVFSAESRVPEECKGQPRLPPPKVEAWGGRIGALVDPDGTLVRLLQN